MSIARRLGLLILLPLALSSGRAGASEPVNERSSRADVMSAMPGLNWRSIGPQRGGRVTAVAGVPGEALEGWMGATGGGVWRTSDGGLSWQCVSDGHFARGSVGAIAVAPSDRSVVYVGMGERDPRGNFAEGDGVYRTDDGGKTWKHLGLAETKQIGRIRIHPTDPMTLWVAALGDVHRPSEERGVYRSRDGGATWERTLFINERTGIVDLSLHPRDPSILLAGAWMVQRTPWSLTSGGEHGGVWRSNDGGTTWSRVEGGLPGGAIGKIGVAFAPSDPSRVYAMIESAQGGLYRSDDGGENWTLINDDARLRQRPWYYTHVYVDPNDRESCWVCNVPLLRSRDGGKTFESVNTPHGDHHDLWINPADSRHVICGNDGGATVSRDGGASWTTQQNQATGQFYHVAVDDREPYRVYGAQQDNSTISISSRGGGGATWSVGGGESGMVAIRSASSTGGDGRRGGEVIFAGSYGGYLSRFDQATGEMRTVSPWPDDPLGRGAADLRHRFQWTFPILLSRHDPSVILVASQHVLRSRDDGQSWETISPDLTTANPDKMGSSGGPLTKDNTSVEYHCTVFALAESAKRRGMIWAGTDDGRLHITKDDGASWQEVTPPELEPESTISAIDASPHEALGAWVAVSRLRLGDGRAIILATSDGGESWRRLGADLPHGAVVRAVREDPERVGLLYAACETGLFVSHDAGEHWSSLQYDLPRVAVTDLLVKGDDLVISTQGRGFWIFSALPWIRQWTPSFGQEDLALLTPPVVRRDGRGASLSLAWRRREVNEMPGLSLEVLDEKGAIVRTARAAEKEEKSKDTEPEAARPPSGAGFQRFSWDLRAPGPARVPGLVLWNGEGHGADLVPGSYTVRLRSGESSREVPLLIECDDEDSPPDAAARAMLCTQVRDAIDRAHRIVNAIRATRIDLHAIEERAKRAGVDLQALRTRLEEARAHMSRIEESLVQPRAKAGQDLLNLPLGLTDRLAGAQSVISTARSAPPSGARSVAEEIISMIAERCDVYDAFIRDELTPLGEELDRRVPELPAVAPLSAEPPQ